MQPLTLDERLTFAGAGALLGTRCTIYAIDRVLANKIRRRLRALRIPAKARSRIRVQVVQRPQLIDAAFFKGAQDGVLIR